MLGKAVRLGCVIFIILIAQSCFTYVPINIQVLKPAKVKISPEVYRVILVSHPNFFKKDLSVKSDEFSNANYDSLRSNEFFNGLKQVLSNSPRYELADTNPVYVVRPNYQDNFQNIKWSEVEKLCEDSAADAAIVLENYQILYTDPVKLHWSPDHGYIATLEMINNSLWKIYLPSKKIIVDDCLQMDTLYWDGYGEYQFEVAEQLPDIDDAINQSCYYAGVKYGERISQIWTTRNRYIITCENNDFKKALDFVNQNKWTDANELWKKHAIGKTNRLAAFASYNLAVSSEAFDNIDEALDWASKAFLIRKESFFENYINILEKRKSEKEVIKNQLN